MDHAKRAMSDTAYDSSKRNVPSIAQLQMSHGANFFFKKKGLQAERALPGMVHHPRDYGRSRVLI